MELLKSGLEMGQDLGRVKRSYSVSDNNLLFSSMKNMGGIFRIGSGSTVINSVKNDENDTQFCRVSDPSSLPFDQHNSPDRLDRLEDIFSNIKMKEGQDHHVKISVNVGKMDSSNSLTTNIQT